MCQSLSVITNYSLITCKLFFFLLKVTYIVMRRTREDRTFKGSVFVEFESADQAKAFVNQESLKYNDQELIKMMK